MKNYLMNINKMKIQTLLFAIFKYVFDIVLLAIILFTSSGTIKCFSIWFLLIEISILGLFYGIYMFSFHNSIIKKRLLEREKRKTELKLIFLSIFLLFVDLVIAGLSIRFQYLILPEWRYILSILMLVIGIYIYYRVINVNDYLFITIKVEKNQKLIQDGPYSYVRHPMYTSIILIYLSIFLILGSIISILFSISFIFILRLRIQDEEKVLSSSLAGYKEYLKKVNYKIIPYIW